MTSINEIYKYYKEVLNDLEEHEMSELIAYARQQNPEANYTDEILVSALETLVDENHEYSCVSQGKYKLIAGISFDNKNYIKTLIRRYCEILNETITEMENEVIVNPFFILEEQEESDVAKMKEIKNCIDTINSTIEYIKYND